MISGKNQIGQRTSSAGTKTYQTYNPQLNTPNPWTFYEATDDEIEEAVSMAHKAYKSFMQIPGKEKAAFLRAIAHEILGLGDSLIEVYMQESGLPKGRAEGERGRTIYQLNTFADLVEEGSWVEATIDTALPERKPVPRPDLRKMLFPLGPVVVFGSSNFPFAYSTAGGDTASALASGCPVIVKSHPMHAGTGEMVAGAIAKAVKSTGMPHGVFSNLNSSGIEVGQKLVKHPLVKAVGFTGSINGGRAIYDLAAKREEPIPVFAEMGSINPVVFLPGGLQNDTAHWAKTYAQSITLGTGQFCTNPGLLLTIQSPETDTFAQMLSQEILAIDPTCMLHPSIKKNYDEGKEKMTSQDGVQVLADYSPTTQELYARQAVVRVSGRKFNSNTSLHKEVFGPFSMLVVCEDAIELESILWKLEGQLTGTIIASANELENYPQIVHALQNRVGRIIYNSVPTGVEVCAAMMHGGPYPASSDSRFTAVGIHSIRRWARPVCYQDWPENLLPEELKNSNTLHIERLINGHKTREKLP